MAKYMVMGEISLMSAILRRSMRYSHQNESIEELIRSFSSLKDILSRQSELSDLEPSIYFSPFLDVVRSEETTGSVTAMALTAIAKFLQYGLIDHRLESAAATAEQIVLAMKKISYISDDIASDEVVIMKFLHVIRSLLLSQIGCLLSNNGVCELIQAIIKIIFDASFGVLMKKMAEQTWGEVVQLMFARLPTFSEDVHDDMQLKQLRIRGNGTSIEHRHSQRRRTGPGRMKKTKTQEEMPFSIGNTPREKVVLGSSKPLEHDASEVLELAVQPKAATGTSGHEATQPPSQHEMQQESTEHNEVSTVSAEMMASARKYGNEDHQSLDENTSGEVERKSSISSEDRKTDDVEIMNGEMKGGAGDADETEGGLSESVEIVSRDSIDEGGHIVHLCGSVNSLNELDHHTDEASVDGNVQGAASSDKDFVSSRGVRFTPTSNGDRVPYGLSSIKELLKFISIIICPHEPYNNPEQIILLGLELMTIALEVGGRHIGNFPSLVELVKDDICKSLLALLKTERIGILVATMRVCFLLFESLRSQLKFQLESYLLKLIELITYEGPNKVAAIRHKKRLLQQGTEHFNQKPSKGIDFLMENDILPRTFSPEKVAEFLRSNYQLDKIKIGDYISNRKNVDLLKAFIKSFNFTDTRIDEALRMYLETFRLPGEAQPISLILEHFAEHWHASNGEPFASADAAFTLAYAIIMLNVDQHNHNVKKQSTPMTEEDFIKNLKGSPILQNGLLHAAGVNGGADFERCLLSDIYEAIKTDEIVMPAEQTGIVRENYLWKVLLKRGASPEGRFMECDAVGCGVLDDEVFNLAWSPTLVALSYLLDKVVDDSLLTQKLMAGYRKCATIAAHYGRTEVFDHLIQALYKYTGISSADSVSGVLQALGGDQRAQLTAKMMFTLAHKHGDVMRDGWRQLVDCSLILYRAGLMPASVTTADDFVEPKGFVSIARRKPEPGRTEQSGGGLFSSLVSYITSSESAAQREQEVQLRKVAETCVINFHPDFIFSESTFLRTSALEELVRVLIASCPVPPSHAFVNSDLANGSVANASYDEESTIFGLELLVKVVLKNKDRVHAIWAPVRDHLVALVMGAAARDYRRLLERAVVGMLRLALRLCKGDQMGSQALQNLAMLLLLKPATVRAVARQIVYAVHELLRTSASCLTSRADWQTLFALLSVAGAGLKPSSQALMLDSELLVKMAATCADIRSSDSQSYDSGVQSDSEMGSLRRSTSTVLEQDRGYTSDSEISTRTSKHHLHHNSGHQVHNSQHDNNRHFSTNITGSWIVVGQEESSPAKTGGCSINQYTISLSGCELVPHDAYAMTKAAKCLTQLIRDSGEALGAGVDERNVESCIRCLRVFVEASLHTKSKRPRAIKTSKGSAKIARSPSPTSESDSDGAEGSSAPAEYAHVSVELLDVMHTLHTSCSQIAKASTSSSRQKNDTAGNQQDGSTGGIENQEILLSDPAELWARCWCPLLQGMARLCLDTRKTVRILALSVLQRALLVQELQVLKADHWEACFHQVLFPLLQALLERQVFPDPAVVEETCVRVNTLLSKVFLQHLSPLLTLPTFTALWLAVLHFMDRFMHLEQGGDLLLDAIPESLKNMLLVMDTAGVFRTTKPDGNSVPSELWNVTWDRVAPFLPGLQDELFRKPEPPPAPMSDLDKKFPANSAEQADDMDSELPPVLSLEEALALRVPEKVPLSRMMGGILMQETTLTPSNSSNGSVIAAKPDAGSITQRQQKQAAYSHQQQSQAQQPQHPIMYSSNNNCNNITPYGSPTQQQHQQQLFYSQQYRQQSLYSAPQPQPPQQMTGVAASAPHAPLTTPQQQTMGHNVAMVSPISSVPSSPQHSVNGLTRQQQLQQQLQQQQSLERRLSYDQLQLQIQQHCQPFYYQQQQRAALHYPQQTAQYYHPQPTQATLTQQQIPMAVSASSLVSGNGGNATTSNVIVPTSCSPASSDSSQMAMTVVQGSSISVYPGQAVGQNASSTMQMTQLAQAQNLAGPSQSMSLFYSTGVTTPQAVTASQQTTTNVSSSQLLQQGQYYQAGQPPPPPSPPEHY
ncbi:Golgi-specific brefeldin A-resistance guanine nucleotide exchange factor 1-like isoform X3 [Varroa destructor]|uniref:SEC7 domain-containing protein n=1 Tax=Varroa destructor TaxID=109461 RepID=A0A7M7KBV0_VARDE|nr:Golgi-specific brefeldin A-resistance guanine nucleotide exchange factor 1-like isoform X3 [Varroa destructor]